MPKKWTIGLDFGTSNTYIYGYNHDTNEYHDLTRIKADFNVQNVVDHTGIPTVVAFDDNGDFCIGQYALSQPQHYSDLKYDAREDVDNRFETELTEIEDPQSGDKLSCKELLNKFFEKLYYHLSHNLPADIIINNKEIRQIIVGYPSTNGDVYSALIKESIKKGFQLTEDIPILHKPEPELAGYAYFKANSHKNSAKVILVVDVGGGTTDFSILEKSTSGENFYIGAANDIDSDMITADFSDGCGYAGNDFTKIISNKIHNISRSIEDYKLENISDNLVEIKEKLTPSFCRGRGQCFRNNNTCKPFTKFCRDARTRRQLTPIRLVNISSDRKLYIVFDKNYNDWDEKVAQSAKENDECYDSETKEILDHIVNNSSYIINYKDNSNLSEDEDNFNSLLDKISIALKKYLDQAILAESVRNIDGILFIGGTTRFPELRDKIVNTVNSKLIEMGREPQDDGNNVILNQNVIFPDNEQVNVEGKKISLTCSNAVAFGACLFGADIKNYKTKERTIILYMSNMAYNTNDIETLRTICSHPINLFDATNNRDVPSDKGLPSSRQYPLTQDRIAGLLEQQSTPIFQVRVADRPNTFIKFDLDLELFEGDLLIKGVQYQNETQIICYDVYDGKEEIRQVFHIGMEK